MRAILELAIVAAIGTGSLCVLLAAVGVVRMPDLFTRMQASSKAATLGAILILAGSATFFADGAVAMRAGLIAIFLALTTPIGSHLMARAGYRLGIRMADPDTIDELARYEQVPRGPRDSDPRAPAKGQSDFEPKQ